MRYFYDKSSDSLYLTLAERKYADSVEAAPGVVLDFDAAGRLIGIDLEHASHTIDIADLSLQGEPTQSEATDAKMSGAELKRDREALGLSQAQLGHYLAVSPNTIARWERGELKVLHSGMLSLALSALKQQKMRSPRRTSRRSLPKRASSLLKSTPRSNRSVISRHSRSQSSPERAKRK
jgi:DNA-binding transcriptional regulator YiaG